MNLLLTAAVTLLALAISITTLHLYILFGIKYRILKSLWQVPLVFLAFLGCVFFNIFAPMILISAVLGDHFHLPLVYQRVSFGFWLVFNVGFVFWRVLRRTPRLK
jgi:hypothetical protein